MLPIVGRFEITPAGPCCAWRREQNPPSTDQSTGKSMQLVTAVESVKQARHRLDQYQATLMMLEPPSPPMVVIFQYSMAMVHATKIQPSAVKRKPKICTTRMFILTQIASGVPVRQELSFICCPRRQHCHGHIPPRSSKTVPPCLGEERGGGGRPGLAPSVVSPLASCVGKAAHVFSQDFTRKVLMQAVCFTGSGSPCCGKRSFAMETFSLLWPLTFPSGGAVPIRWGGVVPRCICCVANRVVLFCYCIAVMFILCVGGVQRFGLRFCVVILVLLCTFLVR